MIRTKIPRKHRKESTRAIHKRNRTAIHHLGKILMALLYVVAGINHFWHPAPYLRIMPDYLPSHAALVALSGVAEVGLGLALFIPGLSRWAAWGIIALLVAVFPANLNMLHHPELTPDIPLWALWLRLPLQALLIAWAYAYTHLSPAKPSSRR